MSYIKYNIYKSNECDLQHGIKELLRNVSLSEHPIRLVFFMAVGDDYNTKLHEITEIVKRWYTLKTPLVTLVAQRPLGCRLAVEIQSISKQHLSNLDVKSSFGVRYSILIGNRSKMLFSEGVRSKNKGVKMQGDDIFKKLQSVFEKEHLAIKDIDRQWNYIEDITSSEHISGESRQKYQEFNDARSDFYATQDWAGGYPAATGIGTQGGGVVVEVDAAIKTANGDGLRTVGIDNALQISAHKYSEGVLEGQLENKTTPKFERARAIVNESIFGDKKAQIYISGTAAIRGEESLQDDIEKQTMATLENIEFLISKNNLKSFGVELIQIPKVVIFRVYLKKDEDYNSVKQIMVRKYPAIPTLYVKSEICRKELLIEIEGIAE